MSESGIVPCGAAGVPPPATYHGTRISTPRCAHQLRHSKPLPSLSLTCYCAAARLSHSARAPPLISLINTTALPRARPPRPPLAARLRRLGGPVPLPPHHAGW